MRKFLIGLFELILIAAAVGLGFGFIEYRRLQAQLPDPESLRHVELQTPLEIYSRDGRLIAVFGDKKRVPVAIGEVPRPLVQAFLAAEDDRFYQHPGVDPQGLLRAAWELLRTGHKRQGGSTITMQVARNFFLSPEKTYERKFKEILLALKMEQVLSKDEILELYLNKIYLGHHAYGIAAAAQIYYGKTLEQLTLPEMAMLAGLPKAPSRFNPISDPQRARLRRDYVLRRMHELGFIDDDQYRQALRQPLTASLHQALAPSRQLDAPYVAEQVRNQLHQRFGDEIYTAGYRVITTLDSRLQRAAQSAVRTGLHRYDERHGYRGQEGHIDPSLPESERLQALQDHTPAGATVAAQVLAIDPELTRLTVLLASGKTIRLDRKGLAWAYRTSRKRLSQLRPGDVIRVRRDETGAWRLAQIPQVQGALLSLDSRSGAVRAMVGGYDFSLSKFNRTVQSQRQPGSGFKPILHTAALEAGMTAATVINDAPIVYANGESEWRPENYSGKFYGPTRLRVALRNSRNLVSIRLLRRIGLDRVIDTALRFGFRPEQLPRTPSLALGSGTASLWDMGRVFSTFANGGFRIEPYLIERIERRDGTVITQAEPARACDGCDHAAPRIVEPRVHYLMHSMLQDVVRRGTAVRAKQLGRGDLAGKTGTTNDQRDAWFNGYAPPLVAIAWVGFDDGTPLGRGETGAHAALPIWIDYMKVALDGRPEYTFPQPEGIVTARIDPQTGLRTHEDGIPELFRVENLPPYQPAASGEQSESLLNELF
ncbi:penicillin-binding protein 1A [Methylomarinovum caldicuralii]|uniref:Penicillin-binding protein 1A n=1 Tax=Methylomarinovum caldicuralii TaxID=438856 RepID=A0AAU9CLH3_9GAMM|nr:penicillin-binding protein 1A [Methylomarinovum caldicuralii]BCX82516.1 penicillin-binding protein 1A [Methylomarinovum caldicuralii]